jgi:hypothetical protein
MAGTTLSVRRGALVGRCAVVDDEVLFYRRSVSGVVSGLPIVLVHGVGVSGSSVEPTASRLAERHDVLVPDLPGFGRSSSGAAYLDTVSVADVLSDWIDAAAIGPAHVVGSSYGLVERFVREAVVCLFAAAAAFANAVGSVLQRKVALSPTISPCSFVTTTPCAIWRATHRCRRDSRSTASTRRSPTSACPTASP